jgi:hypothetical protein
MAGGGEGVMIQGANFEISGFVSFVFSPFKST